MLPAEGWNDGLPVRNSTKLSLSNYWTCIGIVMRQLESGLRRMIELQHWVGHCLPAWLSVQELELHAAAQQGGVVWRMRQWLQDPGRPSAEQCDTYPVRAQPLLQIP